MASAALIISTTQWSQDVTQLDNLLADHQSGYTPANVKGKACSHQDEVGAKAKKIKRQEKNQRINDKHQRKFSLPLSTQKIGYSRNCVL